MNRRGSNPIYAGCDQRRTQDVGSSIVGFGRYRYKYESGREGDSMITGFSPRKGDLTLYIMRGFDEFPDLMKRLGKHKTGKSCLYIKNLANVDVSVLRKLSRLLPLLVRYAVAAGLVYGAAAYFIMSFIVVPLSAIGPRTTPTPLPVLLNGIIGHALLVGLPIALVAWRSAKANKSEYLN